MKSKYVAYVLLFFLRFGVGLEGQVQFEHVVRWCAGQYTGIYGSSTNNSNARISSSIPADQYRT
jgi:hypothetical protein